MPLVTRHGAASPRARKIAFLALAAWAAATSSGGEPYPVGPTTAPSAAIVSVRQDFPWSNDVEILYSIANSPPRSVDLYAVRIEVSLGGVTNLVVTGVPATNTPAGRVVWSAPATFAPAPADATLALSFEDVGAPGLSASVSDSNGAFAGTAVVLSDELVGRVRDFSVAVRTACDSPVLNLTFADAESAIKSMKYSTDSTTYTDIPVSGESKTENVSFDVADALGGVLTEGEPAVISFQVADVVGNIGEYAFTIDYDSTADYSVGSNASATPQGDGTTEGDVLYANDSDGSSEVVVDPDFAFDEGDSTSQRVGMEYDGEMYWSGYQTFDEDNPTATLGLTRFDGLLDAMGAQDGVIPDGSYDLTVFVQDDYGHDPQQVGDPQTLVVDTTAPVIETVAVAGDSSGEVSIKDGASAGVVVTLAQPDATNVRLTLDDKVETIPAGYTESDPIVIYRDVDYVYGKNELLVRATDKAGNTSAKTFIVWYNTTPTATAFTANGSEWGPGNKGIDEHGEPFDYSSEQYVALDFAGNVDDNNETPVENLVITVPQEAVVNGALYKKEANGPYVPLEPEEGVFTFKAADGICYLPNRYWSGTETLPFTVTDDANTPTTSDSKNAVVTIDPVTTQTEVDWTDPAAVAENSAASEQVIGTFTYPSNKPRTWMADWIPGNATAHILNDASDSIGGLFDTDPSFSVIEGDTVDGLTNFSIVMNDWVLSEYVWCSQTFIATLSGALVDDLTDVIGENSSSLTFTVDPVNQNPEAGDSKAFNVSLSTLSKQDVTLTLDNTMFSDIDDLYDDLTVASATLASGGRTNVIAQGESGVLEINGVGTTFTLSGKTIVIASNDASALDKRLVEIGFTVTDNFGGSEVVAGSTIKFRAYTTDDDVATVQDVASYSFNVLQNDYNNAEGWDGKTFAISGFTAIDSAAGTLELIDANSITANNFTFTPAAGWRGTVAFNYTIANLDNPSETADATVTIVVAALVGTTPIVEVTDANTAEIASGVEQTTIAIGSASMPTGAEALGDITAQSKEITAYITASDSLEGLLEEFAFNLDAETGAIAFTYTQFEHVWGSQRFELTVTSEEGGTNTVEWTFTVNPVNDTPEVQVAAKGMGAKDTAIQVAFDVVDVETPTADLTYTLTAVPTYGTLYRDGEELAVGDTFTIGNGITYRVNEGAPEEITGDSFTYAVTDRGEDAGLTEADSIRINDLTGVIVFNRAPVIENYVGTKTVDTSAGAQSGSWLLFRLSDVVDPEGEPITQDNITLSGDAVWVGDSVYINYDFAQGTFGPKTAQITISDPIDDTITSGYSFTLTPATTD